MELFLEEPVFSPKSFLNPGTFSPLLVNMSQTSIKTTEVIQIQSKANKRKQRYLTKNKKQNCQDCETHLRAKVEKEIEKLTDEFQ